MGLFSSSKPPSFKISGLANKVRNTSNAALLQELNSIPWSQQAQDATIGSVRDAYINQATRAFNTNFVNPFMQNQSARFGGLNNSIYADRFASQLAPQYQGIVDQGIMQGYNIYNQNMQTKYAGLGALNGVLNGVYGRQAQATELDQKAFAGRRPSTFSNFLMTAGNTLGGLYAGNPNLGGQLTGQSNLSGGFVRNGNANSSGYANPANNSQWYGPGKGTSI